MAVEKVIKENNSRKRKILSENKWIHINLKNVKKAIDEGERVSFVNNKGYRANKFEGLKSIDKLSNLGLISADIMNPTLSSLGEEVCRKGGWILYLRQKFNIERIKRAEESEIQKLNVENLKLQNENLEYQKTIRTQKERIRNLEEQTLFISLLQKYWWIIVTSIGIGLIAGDLLDIISF